MPQKRYWDFKEKDSTFQLNGRLIGIIDPGVYRGYDAAPFQADMVLRLNHTSGVVQQNLNGTQVTYGVAVTTYGIVVKEDTELQLVVQPPVTSARKDIIILEHMFTEVQGGTQAVYSIIQGVEGVNPVKPVRTNVNTQVEIGELHIPAGTTSLNGVGVIWTKAAKPKFADNTVLSDLTALINTLSGEVLHKDQNLNDLPDKAAARLNLGVSSTTDALLKADNLNSVANKATARSNLSLLSSTEIAQLLTDLVNGAPVDLNTLAELAAALNNDPNYHTTVANALFNKVDKVAGLGLSQNSFTTTLLNKLNGIANGANNYVHPATHLASMIVTSSVRSFISDMERTAWNNAAAALGGTRTKVVDIGDWNMDANNAVSVLHGLGADNIRSVTGFVRDDSSFLRYPIPHVLTTGTNDLVIDSISATAVGLFRRTNGVFDSTNFNATSFNRGWLVITYL